MEPWITLPGALEVASSASRAQQATESTSVFPEELSTPSASAQKKRQVKRFTEEQMKKLEEAFTDNPVPTTSQLEKIAEDIDDTEERVKSWFARKRLALKKGEASEADDGSRKRKEEEDEKEQLAQMRQDERLKRAKFAQECKEIDKLRSTLLATLEDLSRKEDTIAALQAELDELKGKVEEVDKTASRNSVESKIALAKIVKQIKADVIRTMKSQLNYRGSYTFNVEIPNVSEEVFNGIIGDENKGVTSLTLHRGPFAVMFGNVSAIKKDLFYGGTLEVVWPMKVAYSKKTAVLKVTGAYKMEK